MNDPEINVAITHNVPKSKLTVNGPLQGLERD